MNSTLSNDSNTIIIESWFIPLDILGIICLGLTFILTSIYLFIIIVDKTCHTVRMMLIGNTCLTGVICVSAHLVITVFTLHNDLKQIQYQDSSCVFRGYSSYATLASHAYSYVLSAIYQYISIVYPTRVFWKSARIQILFIVLSWIWAFIYPIPIIFTNQIIYNVYNQICQAPLQLSFPVFYISSFIFIIPINLVMFIYMKLVRYVKGMNKHVVLTNTLSRAQRDLKIVRRIVILVHILFICGFPMTLFVFLSFANRSPIYHFRIGFIFVYVSLLCIMIVLLKFTDLLQASVKKMIYGRPNMVIPTLTINPTLLFQTKTIVRRIDENTQCQDIEVLQYRKIQVLK